MVSIDELNGYSYDGSQLQREVHAAHRQEERLLNLLKHSKMAVDHHKQGLEFFEAAVKDIEGKLRLRS